MAAWINQAGYPILMVEEKEPEEEGSRVFELSQERFLIDGTKDDSKPLWFIPISVVTSRAPEEVIKNFFNKFIKATRSYH